MKMFVFIFAMLSSCSSFLISLFCYGRIANEFFLIPVYPLLYGLFFLLLWPMLQKKTSGGRLTVGVFLVLQWLRLVALPAMGSASGYFTATGRLIDSGSAQTAGILVLTETIVTFFAAVLILRGKSRNTIAQTEPNQQEPNTINALRGNSWVYFVFVLFAALLFFMTGANMYTFFTLEIAEGGGVDATGEGTGTAISAIIDYGLSFLVILLIYLTHERYKKTRNKRYMYLSLLIALVRICIIQSGSNGRLAVLYPIGAFLLLLPKLYKEHTKTIVRSIVLLGGAVLALMTVYKVFHAFFYDSYLEAIQNSEFDLYDTAQQLDIYFYGVRTVANNIYVSRKVDLDITTFFTDYLRNTFGVHYLFGDTMNTTVAQYNLYIYRGEKTSGYLYSSLAYGQSYLSAVLAPLMTVGNMVIVASFEKWMKKLKSIDSYYIISIIFIRLAYNMFACFPLAWNYASRTLVLGAIVICGASLLNSKRDTALLYENRLKGSRYS